MAVKFELMTYTYSQSPSPLILHLAHILTSQFPSPAFYHFYYDFAVVTFSIVVFLFCLYISQLYTTNHLNQTIIDIAFG